MDKILAIVEDIRAQMNPTAGAALQAAFAVNDVAGNGLYNFTDFVDVLGRCGIFMKRQDLTRLFRHFDANLSEQLDYRQFLALLLGQLPERRQAIVDKTWASLAGNSAVMSMDQFWGAFNPERHPSVLMGDMNATQVARDMIKTLNFLSIENRPDSRLTKDAFSAIYVSQGCAKATDDDWFVALLEGTWGVRENSNDGYNAEFFQKIARVLFEKLRQRSANTARECDTLRLALTQLDLHNTGSLDFNSFGMGLEKFGVLLEPQVSQAFFNYYAQNGLVDIYAFSMAVCEAATI